ncbi:MAG: DNA polymerase III subunit gamma/tau, partial [Gammaproteobacteria bacterium]|nr:DNA polymerase III subunit gamma/tau [Phycisphaerae bacterium]NIQ75391.1 DNA polymerase III subunit gamma/tau [Gammaproteobacteria bacterium]NIR94883.1 DNA polymerase III subunit gamma/tau [Gammaproteobacteria bacterium]NIW47129.1 DNA polymerase III subunit gamma/tau [Gammaproteobacteria bacterium]NIX32247.1 DNA polymerase III subunit gamma/tau [Phycisphaerae bacterium]
IKLSQTETATPARLQAEQSEARRQKAIEAIQHDPHVQAMQSTFNAQLDIDSIEPVD